MRIVFQLLIMIKFFIYEVKRHDPITEKHTTLNALASENRAKFYSATHDCNQPKKQSYSQ